MEYMRTKEDIADEARKLADALASEPTLVGRTLRSLAKMIEDLAKADLPDAKPKILFEGRGALEAPATVTMRRRKRS